MFKLPPGATYGDLTIYCGRGSGGNTAATRAQVESMLTQWRLTLDGVEKFTLSGKQLLAMVEFYRTGLIGDTGYVTIPFQRLWMDLLADQLDPAYGTLGNSSFQLEITQDATSDVNTFRAYSRLEPVAQPLGKHIRISRLTPNITTAGRYYYSDLPKLPGEVLAALHFECDDISKLTNIAYVADEVRLVDAPPALLNAYYREANPNRTPQTAKNFAHLDFASRGISNDYVPMLMATQVLELDFSTAPTTFNIVAEYGSMGQPGAAAA